jgi:hypothetical protein
VAERSIATPRLCTEIIEDSLPCVAESERADLRGVDIRGVGMQAHLEATQARPTASQAAVAEQPSTGALKEAEPTQVTGDSPAAIEVLLDADLFLGDQARRARVASAEAAAASRVDFLRVVHQGMDRQTVEALVVHTGVDTLAADMPAEDIVAEGIVVVDTVEDAKRPS